MYNFFVSSYAFKVVYLSFICLLLATQSILASSNNCIQELPVMTENISGNTRILGVSFTDFLSGMASDDFRFRWYDDADNLVSESSTFAGISEVQEEGHSIEVPNNSQVYWVELYNETDNCSSDKVTINPDDTPSITTAEGYSCVNNPSVLYVNILASQNTTSYIIEVSGTQISNQTGQFVITNYQPGNTYQAMVSNGVNTSIPITVDIEGPIEILKPTIVDSDNMYVCRGSTTTLQVSGLASYYEWYYQGEIVGTGNSFTTPQILEDAVYYVVAVSGGDYTGTNPCKTEPIAVPIYALDFGIEGKTDVVTSSNHLQNKYTISGMEATSVSWSIVPASAGTISESGVATFQHDYTGTATITAIGNTQCATDDVATYNVQLFSSDFTENHVTTTTYSRASRTTLVDNDDILKTKAYSDGLGRQVKIVRVAASPGENHLVSDIEYDDFGRLSKSYLTYSSGKDESLVYGDESNDRRVSFLNNYYADLDDDAGLFGFSQIHYESSPLNRTIKTNGVGRAWADTQAGGQDHGIHTDYEIAGNDEVRFWQVANDEQIIWKRDFYPESTIRRTILTDENGHRNVTYTDLHDRVVLKKAEETVGADVSSQDGWACTYYVYDKFSNLLAVLPPAFNAKELSNYSFTNDYVQYNENSDIVLNTAVEPGEYYVDASNSIQLTPGFYFDADDGESFIASIGAPSSELFGQLVFQYKYNEKQQLIAKKVPGMSDWVYMVYDKWDRLVLTQDPNQRANHQWTFISYDALNRPVLTGILSDTNSDRITRTGMQAYLYWLNGRALSFSKNTTTNHGYGTGSYPFFDVNPSGMSIEEILTVTYYDNYDFLVSNISIANHSGYLIPSGFAATDDFHVLPVKQPFVKGNITGTKTKVLDDSDSYLETITYFDDKYRPIQNYSTNVIGGTDIISLQYDFVGNIRKMQHVHEAYGTTVTINERYTYDHSQRLINTYYKINNEQELLLSSNSYSEMGELIEKNIGNDIQSIDYQYNMRGWLTKINGGPDSFDDTTDKFGMELDYESAGQYNGNIGKMLWKTDQGTGASAMTQSYDFTYDALSRIKKADYNEGLSNNGYYDVGGNGTNGGIDYDLNGNIKSLNRKSNDNDIDQLTYEYKRGNQLSLVEDDVNTANKVLGFDNGADNAIGQGVEEYQYDNNGNMISDANKGIITIHYNHLNLPKEVNYTDENGIIQKINYVYDAIGAKLAKLTSADHKTYYINGFHYVEDVMDSDPELEFVQTSEGRYSFAGGRYEYDLKDHLGNVRATVAEGTGTMIKEEIVDFSYLPEIFDISNQMALSTQSYHSSPSALFVDPDAGERTKKIKVLAGTFSLEVMMRHQNSTGGIDVLFQPDGSSTSQTLATLYNTSSIWAEYHTGTLSIPENGEIYFFIDNPDMDYSLFVDDFKMSRDVLAPSVIQRDDYYPFGLTFNSYAQAPGNLYKYNGKEEQKETGWLDYGARMYMPDLGRWGAADNKADLAPNLTPYRYGFNNPIRFLDPDGNFETDGHFWTVYLAAMLTRGSHGHDPYGLAYFAEAPDHVMNRRGDVQYATGTWALPWRQNSFHALGGSSRYAEARRSASMYNNATSLMDKGFALHRLGDSYAHSRVDNSMYGRPFGHLTEMIADKIYDRPGLYLEYTRDLVATLGGSSQTDMFTFDYVANSGNDTGGNMAVLEAEVRLREGVSTFSVQGDQAGVLGSYFGARDEHYGNKTNYKTHIAEVETMKQNSDGEWVLTGKKETRTFVIYQ